MKYKTIPRELYNQFTISGRIPVKYKYFDQSGDTTPYVWDTETINHCLQLAKNRKQVSYEDDKYLYSGLNKYWPRIVKKDVAVIGSCQPGYECILLSYGSKPFTIEYNRIECSDPRMNIFTVEELEKSPRMFDALLSVSSIEHDGLGRYGDPLDPNGDLVFMQKAKKLIPKNGLFFLQVPVAKDLLVFNEMRFYGKIRLPKLLKGWRVLDTFGFSKDLFNWECNIQPLFVLTPI